MGASFLIPAFVMLCVLSGLRARIDVYEAFVKGAKEGLSTVISIAPYLAAILTATALLRETGAMERLGALLTPALEKAGLPKEAVSVVLLRPLSASAALAAVSDVLATAGPDSRAGVLCCVLCGAGETIFFTGSLYLGAAGVKHARHAIPVALAAYALEVAAACYLV